MRRSIIIGLLGALLLTIFALKNSQDVPLNYFFGEVQAPVSLILLITIIIGVLLGIIFSVPSINKQAKMIQQKNKEIDRLQSLVEDYKKRTAKVQSEGEGNNEEEEQEDKKHRHKKEKRR